MRERDELGDTYYCHRDSPSACRSPRAMNRPDGSFGREGDGVLQVWWIRGAMKRGGPVPFRTGAAIFSLWPVGSRRPSTSSLRVFLDGVEGRL